MKKTLALVLALVLTLGCCCTFASAEEKPTYTFTLLRRLFDINPDGTLCQETWEAMMEEYIGAELEFIWDDVPNDYNDKLGTYLASGDWADAFLMSNTDYASAFDDYGSQGMFANIKDYLGEDSYYMQYLASNKANELEVTSPDGGIYRFGVGMVSYADNGTQVAWTVRADIFEENGIAIPDSMEGIYEAARAPMGAEYGPAYTFNRLGIVYDSAYCNVEIKSFADLWNPELEDSIAIPDMTATTGPMFYFATAETFGLVPGVDDEAIFAKLAELKPNVVNTYTSANNTITMLNQGEISVAVLLDYSYTTAKNANPDYVWVDPVEGSFASYNMINVIAGTDVKDLATEFVNYYISYDVQLAEALDGVDSPVRTDVELTAEQSGNFTYGAEMVSGLKFVDWNTITENQAKWIEMWNATYSVK